MNGHATTGMRGWRGAWLGMALCAAGCVACTSTRGGRESFEVSYYRMEREQAGFNDRYRDRSGVLDRQRPVQLNRNVWPIVPVVLDDLFH